MKFTKYEKHGAYHWRQYAGGGKYKRHVDRIVGWVTERPLLDIGAGDGLITAKLAHVPGTVIGIDNEPSGILAAASKGVTIEHEDAYSLTFNDDQFRAATMIDVLEHFDRPLVALAAARRVITTALYITTPPKDIVPGQLLDQFHYQEWSPEELVTLVESAGFKLDGEVLVVPDEKNMYAKFLKVTP